MPLGGPHIAENLKWSKQKGGGGKIDKLKSSSEIEVLAFQIGVCWVLVRKERGRGKDLRTMNQGSGDNGTSINGKVSGSRRTVSFGLCRHKDYAACK